MTTVVAYGLCIRLGAGNEEWLNDLRSILPPGAEHSDRAKVDISYAIRAADPDSSHPNAQTTVGYVDGQELIRSGDYRYALLIIERHLKLYVAEYAKKRVFIHAGVVAWKGKGVVVPGKSHSGKSTLVAALLRAGATYYSDEFAVVDPLGRIHPYPQPLQLRNGARGAQEVNPAEFSAPVGRRPLKVGLILVTRYREGARWRPRRISPGEGMLALLANTVSARRDPTRALRSLNCLLVGAQLLRGARGEAESLIEPLVRSGYLPA